MERSVNKKYFVLKNVFNKDFIVSAIIPIIIFYVFDKNGKTIDGIILSGGWSIGVVLINYIIERKINALAIMSVVFSGIGLIGTVVSKNATFYLISPIIQDIIVALIFFVSLFFEKSLIQVVVEQSYLKNTSGELKKHPKYKSAWKILTVLWGFVNLSHAVLKIILFYSVSTSTYYAISTAYGTISSPIFIALSIMFPKWYWKK